MSGLFDDVEHLLLFWSDGAWEPSPLDVQPAPLPDEEAVKEQIANAYNVSAEFRRLFDGVVAAQGMVRIAATLSGVAAAAMIYSPDKWVALRPAELEALRWINPEGEVVSAPLIAVIAHELHHVAFGPSDPLINATDAEQNAAEYDFKGAAVRSENLVATELGMADKMRVSYYGASNGAPGAPAIAVGDRFTDGQTVDIVRIGTLDLNVQDHTAKGDSRDLIMGAAGDDIIEGGGGNDHLYGDGGADEIVGGSGDDRVFGGDRSDILRGNSGNDFVNGGEGDDLLESGTSTVDGADELLGGAGNDVIVATSWSGEAVGGVGSDSVYLDSLDPNYSWIVTGGGGASDAIYWNGYRLLGGPKSVIDLEYQDPEQPLVDIGCFDGHGVRYYRYAYRPDVLTVFFPTGGGIEIDPFADGDYGINVGAPITGTEYSTYYNDRESAYTVQTSLLKSPICQDGTFGNYAALPGAAAAIATRGPNEPSAPIS